MTLHAVLQSEKSECGLSCVAMISAFHGKHVSMVELRRRFPQAARGLNLRQLISVADVLGFAARPVRVAPEFLRQMATPCVLHWDMNHFVVLKRVSRRHVTILDPAVGERRVTMEELGRHFTGVALELFPAGRFEKQEEAPRVTLSQMAGTIVGLRASLAKIFCVAIALEFFVLSGPLFNQLVVDEVLTTGDRDLLIVLLIGFALLLAVQTFIALLRSWLVLVLSQALSLQWTSNVFSHLLRLPIDFFEKRQLGDIASRFASVGTIQRAFTTAAIEAAVDGLLGITAALMMFIYSPMLASVSVAAVGIYALLRWAFYRPFLQASSEKLVLSAKEQTHFLETLRSMTPLKLFSREDSRKVRWQNLLVDVQNRDARTAKMNIAFNSINTAILGAENLLIFWLGASFILQGPQSGAGAFTVGTLFAFLAYKNQFAGRVTALINYIVDLKTLGLHADRLADIVMTKPEGHSDGDERPAGTADLSLEHIEASIELKNVSFRYGENEPWVLRNASFKIAGGECVAVTGPSGCGKTTLLKLLVGLLSPEEGDVLYGGLPVRQLGVENVRGLIGTVMQEDSLLTGSLAENISFFDEEVDQQRIEECARIAQVHEDIVRMPMGYQTYIGDLGHGLSGGQKQRILLARALYKRPRILALDEATSHLDVVNERQVTHALGQLKITRIVIAHRPETIAGAQRVVQMREGQVVDVMQAVRAIPTPSTTMDGLVRT